MNPNDPRRNGPVPYNVKTPEREKLNGQPLSYLERENSADAEHLRVAKVMTPRQPSRGKPFQTKAGERLAAGLPLWVTPNMLSSFRVVLAAPIVLGISRHHYTGALVLFLVAAILDWADGALARARGQTSEFGAFLDPLADKIVICSSAAALLAAMPPSPFLGFVVAGMCAFAVLLTGFRIRRIQRARQGFIVPSVKAKLPGKIKMLLECIGVGSLLAGLASGVSDLQTFGIAALGVSVAFALASFFSQLKR